jgi:GntR family transcriptional regulator
MSATDDDVQILDRLQLRYRRVQDALGEEIERGRRPAGSRLPPERALAEHFGVSRVTLRRALTGLEEQGVVARHPGGWTVGGPRIGEPPNALMSFTEMTTSRGLEPRGRVLDRRERPATIDEADLLGLAPGATLFELERLRLMDGVPILIDRSTVPAVVAPGLARRLASADFSTASLYGELESGGVRPARARFAVEAVAADERQAALLDLRPGQPLLRCHQVTEDESGRVIELCDMVYRGDRYRFRATLVRGS